MLLLSSLPDCGTEPLGTGLGGTHSRVGRLLGFMFFQASKFLLYASGSWFALDEVLGVAFSVNFPQRLAPADAGVSLGGAGGGFGGGAHWEPAVAHGLPRVPEAVGPVYADDGLEVVALCLKRAASYLALSSGSKSNSWAVLIF